MSNNMEVGSIGAAIHTQSSVTSMFSQSLVCSICGFSEDARDLEKGKVRAHFKNLHSVSITSCVAVNTRLRKS